METPTGREEEIQKRLQALAEREAETRRSLERATEAVEKLSAGTPPTPPIKNATESGPVPPPTPNIPEPETTTPDYETELRRPMTEKERKIADLVQEYWRVPRGGMEREEREAFQQQTTAFLEKLREIGINPEMIDMEKLEESMNDYSGTSHFFVKRENEIGSWLIFTDPSDVNQTMAVPLRMSDFGFGLAGDTIRFIFDGFPYTPPRPKANQLLRFPRGKMTEENTDNRGTHFRFTLNKKGYLTLEGIPEAGTKPEEGTRVNQAPTPASSSHPAENENVPTIVSDTTNAEGERQVKWSDGTFEKFDSHGILMSRNLPNGTREHYDEIGIFEKRFPDGTWEYYDRNGRIARKYFPEEKTEYYADGKLTRTEFSDGTVVGLSTPPVPLSSQPDEKEAPTAPEEEAWTDEDEATLEKIMATIKANEQIIDSATKRLAEIQREKQEAEKKEAEKGPEVKPYSAQLIKDIVGPLFASVKRIQKINTFDIQGKGDEIFFNANVIADLSVKTKEVKAEAIFESKNGTIVIKSLKIDAGFGLSAVAKALIEPYLNGVSESLKSYIEEKENKKVRKMEIENGELKVTFE